MAASLWFDALPAELREGPARPPASASMSGTDVCIVGGGLTGLWTAYYLALSDPGLRITILEKETVGFGASGRNGGWCSALFPRSTASLERQHGLDAALRMRRAMIDTVAEVGRVVAHEGIDCDFVRGGTVTYARTPSQVAAARHEVEEARRYGVDSLEFVDYSVAGTEPHADGALAGTIDPACARLQPAKLVRHLAGVVERLGVHIHEKTEVVAWRPGRVVYLSPDGDEEELTASRIVIATEAYGATLAGVGRRILPLYSLMIATDPLPEDFWASTGLTHGRTFSDHRNLLIYGQRTADNRFAFGGRGARYHWGSSIRPSFDAVDRVHDHLERALFTLFPGARGTRISHRWGGPLGVSRDWHASVSYNRRTGIGFAGGYVGDGLSTTNLAGRTLAESILERPTELGSLPWVGHLSPKWEHEPFRFIGTNAGLIGAGLADIEEEATGRPSRVARVVGRLTGH